MSTVKLITDNILDLTPDFWLKVGDKIHDWVSDDADKGIMQDNTSMHQYTSPEYVRYKKNNMRRFTKGKGQTFSDKEGYFFGQTHFKSPKVTAKYKGRSYGAGDRLKGYEAGVLSNQTSFVNMRLTSKTLNSLKGKNPTTNSITMHFDGTPAGILTGNRDRGYDIIGLRGENIGKIKKRILAEFMKNSKTDIPPTIIIEVK